MKRAKHLTEQTQFITTTDTWNSSPDGLGTVPRQPGTEASKGFHHDSGNLQITTLVHCLTDKSLQAQPHHGVREKRARLEQDGRHQFCPPWADSRHNVCPPRVDGGWRRVAKHADGQLGVADGQVVALHVLCVKMDEGVLRAERRPDPVEVPPSDPFLDGGANIA